MKIEIIVVNNILDIIPSIEEMLIIGAVNEMKEEIDLEILRDLNGFIV